LFVIGTAGHVDHGKSTLVLALTGIDPDRLAEEKEREMTIDLGFAWLKLPSGREVGVIDVPGHEHFIKNMLAGVSGMDLALLVVDANEGVMQQTREHVAILDLMEIKKGVAVITKADQVDQETITLVTMEIEDLINPTTLAGSPVVAVSSVTRQGLPELKVTIDKVLDTLEPRKDIGKPRLPIDRVFTISGSGTVVTGTLIDGSLIVGQEVEIIPPAFKSRIRSLQTHKTQLTTVEPASRVAANVVGVNSADLKRGYVLTRPGWLTPTKMLDARLCLLKQPDRPLKHNTEVSFHSGSAEVMGRVRLLEKEEVKPGEITWVQFILDDPLAVVKGDHYVIRSPMDTLGGGVILEAHPKERHRRFRAEVIENLKARSEGKVEETVLATLKTRQYQEMSVLLSQSGLAADIAESAIDSLIEQGKVIKIGEGKNSFLFTENNWKQLAENIVAMVADYHRKFPVRLGIPKAEINSKIKLGSHFLSVLSKLFKEGVLVEETNIIRLPAHQIKLSPAQQAKIEAYLKQLTENPYSPSPNIELEADLQNLLVERGQVVKTSGGVVFARSAYDDMVSRIMAHIRKNGKINVGEVRDMFGSSRKFVLPLLEHMDEVKLTRRVGDDRVAC
jgi:selenocysteine-specific elongation factor